MSPAATSPPREGPPVRSSSRGASLQVASGIFLSRISGLVRTGVLAHYLGLSDAADAFNGVALRIPNALQNLLGEGVLSASFIPVYARLVARGDREEAGRVAGAIFSALALIVAVLVLLGVLGAPILTDVIAPGYRALPEKRALAIHLVRICFFGSGLMVLSAWCLGVLNSHGKFFLSYATPILWNCAIIAALVLGGRGADAGASGEAHIAVWAAWGTVVGAMLQFGVQLPVVLRLAPALRLGLATKSEGVRTAARNFVPAFVSRGVLQLSLFIDLAIASALGQGAAAAMTYAQTLYQLPVAVFGMSVSAAELPAMAVDAGETTRVPDALRLRLEAGLRRIAFFVIPSAIALLTIGDVLADGLFRGLLPGGRFTHEGALRVWAILAGSAIGLLAATMARLYSSAFYGLHDTKTPMRFAFVRLVSGATLGAAIAFGGPRLFGIEPIWGAAGITLASGFAGWIELSLLRRALHARIGRAVVPGRYLGLLLLAALLAAGAARLAATTVGIDHPLVRLVAAVAPFGVIYFAATASMGMSEARATLRLRR